MERKCGGVTINYTQARRKYAQAIAEKMENPIPNEKRIYLNVAYVQKEYAKFLRCLWDSEKKLWYADIDNPDIAHILHHFTVRPETAQEALREAKAVLSTENK